MHAKKPTAVLFALVLGLLGLSAPSARAALVITDSAGIATGITGLGVAGNSFDVSFQSGVFSDFFGAGDDFSNANALNAAIAAALNALTDVPRVPRDGIPAGIGQYLVPTQALSTGGFAVGASCTVSGTGTGICVSPYSVFSSVFRNNTTVATYAVATAAAVPEPASLTLFALAALGLASATRRRRAAA